MYNIVYVQHVYTCVNIHKSIIDLTLPVQEDYRKHSSPTYIYCTPIRTQFKSSECMYMIVRTDIYLGVPVGQTEASHDSVWATIYIL